MYLSLETSKKLKEMGCDVLELFPSKEWTQMNEIDGIYSKFAGCYEIDLRDIICNGEMAKAFFGKIQMATPWGSVPNNYYLMGLVELLQQNKQEEAEAYLLKHCVFNPRNKKYDA